jgi:hypothetical protein
MSSACLLEGAPGKRPIGSIIVSQSVLVWFASVNSGHSVVMRVLVIASCRVSLEVQRQPKAWPSMSHIASHLIVI